MDKPDHSARGITISTMAQARKGKVHREELMNMVSEALRGETCWPLTVQRQLKVQVCEFYL